MQAQYVFHSDAGHGWLEVPRADISMLCIDQYISRYSYQQGSRVYLEEDQDMGLFLQARGAKYGDVPMADLIIDGPHVDRSRIRDYPRYQA